MSAVAPPPPEFAGLEALDQSVLTRMMAVAEHEMGSDFTKIVHSRMQVYMAEELEALRDGVIGSAALIRLVKEGYAPEGLSIALTIDESFHDLTFKRVSQYVAQVAWGDAALRHKGYLPALSEVPEPQPVLKMPPPPQSEPAPAQAKPAPKAEPAPAKPDAAPKAEPAAAKPKPAKATVEDETEPDAAAAPPKSAKSVEVKVGESSNAGAAPKPAAPAAPAISKKKKPVEPALPPQPALARLREAKPNWDDLYDYVDRERKNGDLVGDFAWEDGEKKKTLRRRLEKSLDTLNADFIKMAEKHLTAMLFPYMDFAILLTPEQVEKGLNTVTPLPAKLPAGPEPAKPVPHAAEFLEELRSRGQAVRAVFARETRTEGNSLFTKASTFKGPPAEKEELIRCAAEKYTEAFSYGEERTVTACNLAAAHLMQKNYEEARNAAEASIQAGAQRMRDPPTYALKRAASIQSLATAAPLPELTQAAGFADAAQRDAERAILWKALVRKARALEGLIKMPFGMHEGDAGDVHASFVEWTQEAKECYEYAQALDPADKTPTLEKEQLLKYLQTRASHLLKETAKDRAARKGRA